MLLKSSYHQLLTEDNLILLRRKQIFRVLDFLNADNKFLERCTTLTYPKHLAKTHSAPPVNGLNYFKKLLKYSSILSTGIQLFDDLLQGGFMGGTIYEMCGAVESGNYQLLLTIIRNLLYKGEKVYFLDTKRDFSAVHMKEKLLPLTGNNWTQSVLLLENILIKRISCKYDLVRAIFEVKQELREGLSVKIAIIHSVSTLFLSSNNASENNNILNHLANVLRYMMIQYNVIIVLTNLLTSWNDNVEFTENISGGKYWQTVPQVRLKIEKISSEHYDISLMKHNNSIGLDRVTIHSSVIQ
ncbi:hypothetical protein ABEB36_011607 [Hypothenemus hampei]|uniref:Rad51-like C-terminal domain-containing protein n=1 Tax=Hypothenemus hampei TaxID=57062 RepID=A0ABD1E8G2_HYPHA